MDIDIKLTRLASRAAKLMYARYFPTEIPAIHMRLIGQEKPLVSLYASREEGAEVWRQFSRMMTEQCIPPCMAVGDDILFQRAFLLQLVLCSRDDTHFVILDFGSGCNLWLGNAEKAKQRLLYESILTLLGLSALDDPADPVSPV